MRQALGREIALDMLEGFFPNREDINSLTNRGIMHPDFITQDDNDAIEQQLQRKRSVMDDLNAKLNPNRRPSIVQLSDKGLIPENWLLDLYGLADEVRKKHRRMSSAILDLKSQLNVPPILADVVARDVLDEIETVDPYLLQNDNNITTTITDNDDNESNRKAIKSALNRKLNLRQRPTMNELEEKNIVPVGAFDDAVKFLFLCFFFRFAQGV